ncbi:uncharacterized protein LOC101238613 [Trichonephila clavipes]|nr:uncharacterized protein LOC101238613 [Trichonephila clavipes]
MMSSVIAAFFHCVSGKHNSLHGQCPEGSESWCRYQRSKAAGSPLKEIEQGLPNKIINQIKPTYLKLCNETLLKKCLHAGETGYIVELKASVEEFMLLPAMSRNVPEKVILVEFSSGENEARFHHSYVTKMTDLEANESLCVWPNVGQSYTTIRFQCEYYQLRALQE